MTDKPHKKIHLGAQVPADFDMDFDAFVHTARTAERGLFDFVLADDPTVLAALAAVTDKLGLAGTVDTTYNEPFEVARQFATLDHLSDGRAGWHVATTSVADTGDRADEFITVVRKFWDSWAADAVLADHDAGRYVDPDRIRTIEHHGAHFDVRGVATLPRTPQGHPVLLCNGDAVNGARHADVLFTPHTELEARRGYYAEVKAKAGEYGRDPNSLTVFATADAAIGAAADIAGEIDLHVQADACDGFILTPHPTHGLDEFVDQVVPLLQERGSFRTQYAGDTLRGHLGL